MTPARTRFETLQEHARLLAALEAILAADERRFASGAAAPDEEHERARAAILSALGGTREGLGFHAEKAGADLAVEDAAVVQGPSASRSHPRSSAAAPDAPIFPGMTSMAASIPASDDGEDLASRNREAAREIDRRTRALLAAWWIRRNEIVSALGELRDGKKLLEACRAGEIDRTGLDLRR